MQDLNSYVQQERIGTGGYGDVYRAVRIIGGDVVALKKSRSDAECIARTKREIEVQRRLLHANVMPVLDWADDGSWFVMPVAKGDTGLVHSLTPLRGAELLRYIEDVAAALSAAHRRDLVHRDVKPANILWLNDRWVVADWGFVRLPSGEVQTKLTRTGVGSESFTAPEVYRDGSAATRACDVYSLARVVGSLHRDA